MSESKINLFWFRRDLRLDDNHGLYCALTAGLPVLTLFIFDKNILKGIPDEYDRRVNFIYEQVFGIRSKLEKTGSTLFIEYGDPLEVFQKIASRFNIHAVYANHDYEPEAIKRDEKVNSFFKKKNIGFITFKDQVIFEKNEVVKEDGKCYTVFTPYSGKWKKMLAKYPVKNYPSEKLAGNFLKTDPQPFFSLCDTGFKRSAEHFPAAEVNVEIIKNYHLTRDFPNLEGTSKLGVHLRFGTVSIRKLVVLAEKINETYLNELIWREFFMQILFHFPHVVNYSFKPLYDNINWINNENEFDKWCQGVTGYPFVDAGIRELNETGFMHNRSRMVAASFLVKHLLIDWRWGEAWFARHLLDYELSSNNGNWQWAAGCGCDAAPWFRIFNPVLQAKKFDPEEKYMKNRIPEFGSAGYAEPLIAHEFARKRCIEAFNKALAGKY